MEISPSDAQLIYAAVTFLRNDTDESLDDMELSNPERDEALAVLHHCNRLLGRLKKFMDANQISSPL